MKAIRYRSFGPAEVLEWVDVETPSAGPREVLVRVAAASLNPKDCLVRKGKFRLLSGKRFPRACGHDFSGTVTACGSAGSIAEPGDEVFGMLDGWAGGAHAEYVATPARGIARRPRSVALDECAALPLAGLTALQALRDLARVTRGSAVLVNGASGGVGTLAVQIAKALGARVTAVCGAGNAGLVASLGADEVVDYTRTDLPGLPGRYDAIFDVFGNRPFAGVQHLLTARGAYVTTVARLASIREHVLSYLRPGRKAWLVRVHADAADLSFLAQLVDDGRLRPVIDRRSPMSESVEAHRYLETRRARGKVLLIP